MAVRPFGVTSESKDGPAVVHLSRQGLITVQVTTSSEGDGQSCNIKAVVPSTGAAEKGIVHPSPPNLVIRAQELGQKYQGFVDLEEVGQRRPGGGGDGSKVVCRTAEKQMSQNLGSLGWLFQPDPLTGVIPLINVATGQIERSLLVGREEPSLWHRGRHCRVVTTMTLKWDYIQQGSLVAVGSVERPIMAVLLPPSHVI